MVTVGDVKRVILNSLELTNEQKENLHEAYVTVPKEFELSTRLLSEKAKLTHKKLYLEYIEKLNKISVELDSVDRSSADNKISAYRTLKTAEMCNRNAVHLHELYFANISDQQSEIAFDSLCYMKLSQDFGTFDDWQWDFIACALSARNGWAVTAYDTFLRRYVNFIIDDHDCNIPVGCYPVIVLDVWEHAFFCDYQVDKQQYVTNMMRELNWEVIERRVERAEQIGKVLRA